MWKLQQVINQEEQRQKNRIDRVLSRFIEHVERVSSDQTDHVGDPKRNTSAKDSVPIAACTETSSTVIQNLEDTEEESSCEETSKVPIVDSDLASNHYVRIGCLGKGAYAVVVDGIHKAQGNRVAIKVVLLDNATPQELERIEREVVINQRIRHPNVVRAFKIYRSEEEVSFILEYMPGGCLKDKVTREGALTEEQGSYYIAGVLSALKYLHSLRIAHRDLKPENLLFDSEDTVSLSGCLKIIDFGFAKQETSLHKLKSGLGTPHFCAPEVHRSCTPYTNSVDIWSIGCVVFFMLSGKLPFGDDTNIQELYTRSQQGTYFYPEGVHISDLAKDFVSGCIEVESSKRMSAKNALRHPWITHKNGDLVPLTSEESVEMEETLSSQSQSPKKRKRRQFLDAEECDIDDVVIESKKSRSSAMI